MKSDYRECAKAFLDAVKRDCGEHPLLCSLFLMDAVLLLFFRYWMPFPLALVLVGGLIYLSMFFGAKHASGFPGVRGGKNGNDRAG